MCRKCLTIQLETIAEKEYLETLTPEAREAYLAKDKALLDKLHKLSEMHREKRKLNNG